MRRTLLFTVALIAGLTLLASGQNLSSRLINRVFASINSEQDRQEKKRGLEKEGEEREEHVRELLRRHSDSSGNVREDLWKLGVDHFQRMKVGAAVRLVNQTNFAAAGGVVGVQWKQVGPAPLIIDKAKNYQGDGPDSGEVLDIAIDPRGSTDRVIYIATNDGGIWKSTDGGTSWKPKTDFLPSLSMGAVALDPANPSIVYAGTGNPYDGAGRFSKGVGIYKSIDGGETWNIIGARDPFDNKVLEGRAIVRIALPTSGVLLVATRSGLFRSIDGGLNFGNNAPNFNNGSPLLTGFITDLHLDTASPTTTVLAAVSGQGIFRSTDAGATFPATGNLFNNTGAPTGSYGNLTFAQSTQPNNQTIYASVASGSNYGASHTGLYKSSNGGNSWMRMSGIDTPAMGCFCGYVLTVGVDPQDAERVYVGFQELFYSINGGGAFTNVSNSKIHYDHHAITFSPQSHIASSAPTRVWTGTDGGIHSSTDAGSSWANLNAGIATNLFFSLDIGRGSAMNNEYSYGGTQDTGTIERRPEFTDNDWHLGIDGDGGFIAVDPCNPKHAIGTDNGTFISTGDGGDNWAYGGGGFPSGTNLQLFRYDHNCTNAYASSGKNLFQSTDNAGTFSSIKTFGANITAIAVTKQDSNTLWVALDDGTLQRTANVLMGSSATWSPAIIVNDAPAGIAPSSIAIDPTNTNIAVVVYPRFTGVDLNSAGEPVNRTKHVFMTTDNGNNWSDISGTDGGDPFENLPDIPVFDVVIDPGTIPHAIIIATDAGVLRTSNIGATWEVYGLGLPTVYCSALALDYETSPSVLRVGTYGRSVFELSSAEGPLLGVNANPAFGEVCVGQSQTHEVQLFNVGSSDLHINSFFRFSGSAEFQLISGPSTPATILPGSHLNFTIRFSPGSAGNKTAIFQINSDDLVQPARQISVSGAGVTKRIATLIADSGNFGGVCLDSFKDLGLTISNSGSCDLTINNITVSPGTDFLLPFPPAAPLIIHAGDSLVVPIRFQPASKGSKSASIRIFSDDMATPIKTVAVSGVGLAPSIITNDPILFDKTCPGNVNNKTLTIGNSGQCDLIVKSITSSSSEFKVIGVVPFPLIVPPGSTRDVAIQFMPMGFTIDPMRMATLTIMSNDPDTPMKSVKVKGTVPPPIIQAMPDPLDFGKVCLGKSKELPLTIKNNGECNLTVSSISFSSTEFKLVPLPTFPFVIPPGGSRTLMVSFMPVGSTGMRMATMTINSDDPATPIKIVTLKGEAPVSDIAISGPTDWGEVMVGKFKDQIIYITNTEACDLAISLVCEVRNGPPMQASVEFNLVSPLNYPVIIPGGATLPVKIRFKPERTGPRSANLFVCGFDPQTPGGTTPASCPPGPSNLKRTVVLTGKGK